jgi:hypothetical protein
MRDYLAFSGIIRTDNMERKKQVHTNALKKMEDTKHMIINELTIMASTFANNVNGNPAKNNICFVCLFFLFF